MVDWDTIGDVNYIDTAGDYIYEFVIKVPDQPVVSVGDCFTPVYYDATLFNGVYVDPETPSYDGMTFCIGEPYLPLDGLAQEEAFIYSFFKFADDDSSGCVTKDEMIALFEWGLSGEETMLATVDAFYMSGDLNADGLTTWSEFNQWIDSLPDSYLGTEVEAQRALFQYFDASSGNADFALSRDEAEAGVTDLMSKIGYFYDDYNFYWQFFDKDDDTCVTLEELE